MDISRMPPPPFLYAHDLSNVLKKKNSTRTNKSLVFYLEACDSGSNFDGLLPKGMNIYATTSTKPDELDWATYCPGDPQNPPPQRISHIDIHNPQTETLEQQYELIKVRTLNNNLDCSSHVMQYDDIGLSQANPSFYIGANSTDTFVDQSEDYLWSPSQTINQRDADLSRKLFKES
ncbi:vacuolar-processing enzyme [Quercus suber]|uniref:Vacuolar-processing enzyme n=1 Tax=Quercus suber TaxID=58331 RepID=A0AAW0LRH6_QUESU